jgi:hypothetical protein
MNSTINNNSTSSNETFIDAKSKRNYDVASTIATLVQKIIANTTQETNETTESWEVTTVEITTEAFATTMPPPPAEAPCQQYWYDLNTTSVYHVSQGMRFINFILKT